MNRCHYGLWIVILLLSGLVACQSAQPPAQSAAADPDQAPAPVAGGKTHLVFAGVTANFPRIAVWLFQGMYQELPRGTFRGDVKFIGDGAVVATRRVCDGQGHFAGTTPPAGPFPLAQA